MDISIIYGTAWKKEKTKDLVALALKQGFRAIDTACQPKHYQESGVGEGIAASGLNRDDLFIQTKFTSVDGQDPNTIPYDPKAPIPDQVATSLACSLKNLATDTIDSWVLHGPLRTFNQTLEAWRSMESHCDGKKVRQIGLSNIYDPAYLKDLLDQAKIKPSVLQNRFYQETGYDQEIRALCAKNGIRYQSFWTLTANPHVLRSRQILAVCEISNQTPAQVFFCYLKHRGITPLTGTKDAQHMKEDLDAMASTLTDPQLARIDRLFLA